MAGLPAVCYGLAYACNEDGCSVFQPPGFIPATKIFTWEALGVFLAWLLLQVGALMWAARRDLTDIFPVAPIASVVPCLMSPMFACYPGLTLIGMLDTLDVVPFTWTRSASHLLEYEIM